MRTTSTDERIKTVPHNFFFQGCKHPDVAAVSGTAVLCVFTLQNALKVWFINV